MWPKALAQLVELAPHVARLLPMADRFLESRAATDDTGRRWTELAAELRREMGKVAATQAALAEQQAGVAGSVAAVATELAVVRLATEQLAGTVTEGQRQNGERLSALEARLDRAQDRVRLGPVVLLLVLTNLILLAALFALLLRSR